MVPIGEVWMNLCRIVAAILAKPEETLKGAFVLAYVKEMTTGELLQAWARA
jgi:hypothetical protein